MLVNQDQIGGEILRDTDVYQVEDNSLLEHLTLSKTTLYPGKETRGHSHPGKDEIYFFTSGSGFIQLDEEKKPVKAGDIVLIPHGAFHRVYNTAEDSSEPLVFICVFEKYQRGT